MAKVSSTRTIIGVLVLIALAPVFFHVMGRVAEEVPGAVPVFNVTYGPATLDEFNRLQHGMSYARVCEIIGAPGTLSSSSHIDGAPGFMDAIDTVMYTWKGSGDFGANMIVMFQNDRLNIKSQFGLK